MKEYDSFENVRDALRCLDEYFNHPFDKYIYLLIDKKTGEAAISDDPANVIEQWVEDYSNSIDCIEDFNVYEYRKIEDIQEWLNSFENWKKSCIQGYVKKESNISASWELSIKVV